MADTSTPPPMTGPRVIATGAAGGIGRAVCEQLLALGATVHALDLVPESDPAWAQLDPGDGRLIRRQADVTSEETWRDVADELHADGVLLDGLVNNAGITLRKTVTQTDPDEWARVMSINLTAAYLAIRAISPVLRSGGSIVNMSSSAGLTGYFGAAYSTSKWALRGLTKAAAIELAARGIRVNAVCPGLVDTAMTRRPDAAVGSGSNTFFDELAASTPMARGAAPTEIADAVAYLLGPQSSFITGTELPVDGGMLGGGLYARAGRNLGVL